MGLPPAPVRCFSLTIWELAALVRVTGGTRTVRMLTGLSVGLRFPGYQETRSSSSDTKKSAHERVQCVQQLVALVRGGRLRAHPRPQGLLDHRGTQPRQKAREEGDQVIIAALVEPQFDLDHLHLLVEPRPASPHFLLALMSVYLYRPLAVEITGSSGMKALSLKRDSRPSRRIVVPPPATTTTWNLR